MRGGYRETSEEASAQGHSAHGSEFNSPDFDQHSKKDSCSDPAVVGSLGPADEIQWHYLTFETELPSPAYLAGQVNHDQYNRAPPPECPDLREYTNPFNWPRSRKNFMTWFGCIATTITAYTAGSYAAGNQQYMEEWHISEPVAQIGIALFTAGFGIAPMFLAPFSEINGRRPVFVVTGSLFVVFQLTCALTPTFAGMLVARFLVGAVSSTFSTMVGGVISDYYHAADRNWAMAMFAGGAIGGTGLGPLCSGFIAQNTSWRWIFRLQVCTTGLLMIVIIFFFKESRGSILLSRKAKALNKWYEQLEAAGYYGMSMPQDDGAASTSTEKHSVTTAQRIRWKVKSDEERATVIKMISISLYRPFHLLVTEPVVLFFSLWITFAWACLYLLFSAVPLIFSTRYNFNVAQSGAVFAVISVGAILITIVSIYQEPVARHFVKDERYLEFLSTPEGRLLFCCVQSTLLPIGCFWFGWTCFPSIHWIVPTIGVGCASVGVFSVYLAVFNYLADCYHR